MANDPVDDIDGLTSTSNVSKSETVAELKAVLRVFANADAVRAVDLSGRTRIMIEDRLYHKDSADVRVDDGVTVVVDDAGNHWIAIIADGVAIDAIGTFAGRDSYDDESANFVYLSEDGDGGSITDAVLFVKKSASSGDWSDPIEIRGPSGGDRYEFTNWDSDRPASGEEVIGAVMTQTVTFPAGLTSSRAKASVASTGSAVYSIKKNGTQVGTLTFSASATGEFAMASQTAFSAGDVLTVEAPNPRDATLSGVKMALVGTT